MLALVSWKCECGLRVKVLYDKDGRTIIRCPTCPKIHAVGGKISHLWANDDGDEQNWTAQDVSRLIVQRPCA